MPGHIVIVMNKLFRPEFNRRALQRRYKSTDSFSLTLLILPHTLIVLPSSILVKPSATFCSKSGAGRRPLHIFYHKLAILNGIFKVFLIIPCDGRGRIGLSHGEAVAIEVFAKYMAGSSFLQILWSSKCKNRPKQSQRTVFGFYFLFSSERVR